MLEENKETNILGLIGFFLLMIGVLLGATFLMKAGEEPPYNKYDRIAIDVMNEIKPI